MTQLYGSMYAMASHANELEIAKKNLTDAIGDNVKQWVDIYLMVMWEFAWVVWEIQSQWAIPKWMSSCVCG